MTKQEKQLIHDLISACERQAFLHLIRGFRERSTAQTEIDAVIAKAKRKIDDDRG